MGHYLAQFWAGPHNPRASTPVLMSFQRRAHVLGQLLDVWFVKDALVGARNGVDLNVFAGEPAPARFEIYGAKEGLSLGAQEQDFTGIGLRDVGGNGPVMAFDELLAMWWQLIGIVDEVR